MRSPANWAYASSAPVTMINGLGKSGSVKTILTLNPLAHCRPETVSQCCNHMLVDRILLSRTATGILALRAALPKQDRERHQGMVAVLDAVGIVAEVASPWGGITPGSAYLHCVERAIGEINDPDRRGELAHALADVLFVQQGFRCTDLRCRVGNGTPW